MATFQLFHLALFRSLSTVLLQVVSLSPFVLLWSTPMLLKSRYRPLCVLTSSTFFAESRSLFHCSIPSQALSCLSFFAAICSKTFRCHIHVYKKQTNKIVLEISRPVNSTKMLQNPWPVKDHLPYGGLLSYQHQSHHSMRTALDHEATSRNEAKIQIAAICFKNRQMKYYTFY